MLERCGFFSQSRGITKGPCGLPAALSLRKTQDAMLPLVTFALAFNVPVPNLGRRQALQASTAAILAGTPLASYADGAA